MLGENAKEPTSMDKYDIFSPLESSAIAEAKLTNHSMERLTCIDWIKENALYFSEIRYGFKDYILGFSIRGAHVPF